MNNIVVITPVYGQCVVIEIASDVLDVQGQVNIWCLEQFEQLLT